MPLSDPMLPMIAQCRPVCTAPTWKKRMILLTGTILARGRRTVTSAVSHTGHPFDTNVRTCHQVLHRARWSPFQVRRHVRSLIVETVVHAGGGRDVVIDDTRERRS